MPLDPKILILGGGPTGLGAAWRLNALGCNNWESWDRDTVPGGLARSFTDEHGFVWDIGGHVQFSHYKTFDEVMDQALGSDGWLHHERESWVRILGKWIPYPFQYNIHRLPEDEKRRCFEGMQAAHRNASPGPFANFEDLIHRCFGEGLADLFMMPYNFKVWAYPPRELATGWIGDRVALPDLKKISESIEANKDNLSWGPNNTFRFPKHGGTGAVWKAVADGLPQAQLHFGREAVRIDPARKIAIDAAGVETRYDALISTLPLDILVRISGLDELREAASQLKYSSVHIVGFGLHGKPAAELAKKCWMYFPENNCPFYRVTVFSNYSPNNVPDIDRYWSLMAEISESPHKPVDRGRIIEDSIQGMLNAGLISRRDQINHSFKASIERGYPTPTLGRDAALNQILPALEKLDIYSRGRFGAWKYEVSNQDHSLMQGVEAVDKLISGTPEETIWNPDFVNRPRTAKDVNRR